MNYSNLDLTISRCPPRYTIPATSFFREELADIREMAALTQVELIVRLGVGQSYISKAERGETYIDALLLVDWCSACGVQSAAAMEQLAGHNPLNLPCEP